MLVDSNILVYAINIDSSKYLKAKKFLEENQQNLQVAHQNILETLRVITHKKFEHPIKIKNAIGAVEGIIKGCNIISPDNRTHTVTLRLIEKYDISSDGIFDAYLVATALCNGIDVIATDNVRDLGKFEGIKIINPFTAKTIN